MYTFLRRPLASKLTLSAVATLAILAGCESSDKKTSSSSSSVAVSSSSYPSVNAIEYGNVQVQFPPNHSQTHQSSVTLRGQVLDADSITNLTVNDETIALSDWADWQVAVPLEEGANEIVITSLDSNAEPNVQTWTVYREAFTTRVSDVLNSENGNSVYLLDGLQGVVLVANSENGEIRQLSPALNSDVENTLSRSTICLVEDTANNRLLVAQQADQPIIQVDLTSGDQTPLEIIGLDELTLNNSPTAMTLHDNTLYVADTERLKLDEEGTLLANDAEEFAAEFLSVVIYQVSLADNTASIVYRDSDPLEAEISPPANMEFDNTGNSLIFSDLFDGDMRLNRYDLDTQTRTNYVFFLDDDIISIQLIRDFQIIPDARTGIILTGKTFYSFDLQSSTLTSVSSNSVPENHPLTIWNTDRFSLTNDSAGFIYYDESTGQLVNTNIETGERTALSSTDTNSPNLVFANSLEFNAYSQELLIADPYQGNIYRLDHSQKYKQKVVARDDFEATDDESDTVNPVLNPARVVGLPNGDIIAFDTPRVTRISKNEDGSYTPTTIPNLATNAKGAEYNPSTQTLYFLESLTSGYYLTKTNSIEEEEPTIERTLYGRLSGSGFPRADWSLPTSMTWNASIEAFLFSDSYYNGIRTMDPDSGETALFSGYNENSNADSLELNQPKALIHDPRRNQVLVVDSSNQAIIAIDGETREKTIWMDYTTTTEYGLANPVTLERHPFFQFMYVYDELSHHLLAIDIPTKQIVRISR